MDETQAGGAAYPQFQVGDVLVATEDHGPRSNPPDFRFDKLENGCVRRVIGSAVYFWGKLGAWDSRGFAIDPSFSPAAALNAKAAASEAKASEAKALRDWMEHWREKFFRQTSKLAEEQNRANAWRRVALELAEDLAEERAAEVSDA
jgi:hypothetical protein